MAMARNRKRPRARTWTFDDLDRSCTYRLTFDPIAFRWEVRQEGEPEPLVTRVHRNRRSAWEGDRQETGPATGPQAAEPRGHRGRHVAEDAPDTE